MAGRGGSTAFKGDFKTKITHTANFFIQQSFFYYHKAYTLTACICGRINKMTVLEGKYMFKRVIQNDKMRVMTTSLDGIKSGLDMFIEGRSTN